MMENFFYFFVGNIIYGRNLKFVRQTELTSNGLFHIIKQNHEELLFNVNSIIGTRNNTNQFHLIGNRLLILKNSAQVFFNFTYNTIPSYILINFLYKINKITKIKILKIQFIS